MVKYLGLIHVNEYYVLKWHSPGREGEEGPPPFSEVTKQHQAFPICAGRTQSPSCSGDLLPIRSLITAAAPFKCIHWMSSQIRGA